MEVALQSRMASIPSAQQEFAEQWAGRQRDCRRKARFYPLSAAPTFSAEVPKVLQV